MRDWADAQLLLDEAFSMLQNATQKKDHSDFSSKTLYLCVASHTPATMRERLAGLMFERCVSGWIDQT